MFVALLLAACGRAEPAGKSHPEPTPPVTAPAQTPQPEDTDPLGLGEIVITQTPEPTATPDLVSQKVSQFTLATGMTRRSFLGLGADDWINLGISLLYVLAAYMVGTLLTRVLLRWVARRTSPKFGDALTKAIGPRLRWLLVILALGFATGRLTFLYAELKTFLSDVYFVLSLVFGTLIVWSLIDLGHDWYREKLKEAGRVDELDPVLTLLTRVARIVVVIISLSILLSNFGINITALLAALGIGGLAFSLAAQDTLADAIAGFIILADRPYRVGDRIEIQGEGTWGDVVDIGLRTTRIRTRDNRMVIVPNSLIGKSQVINYTYPDPRYRIEMHVGIAYGTDIETARRLIVETVRGVEGVLLDKPVDALYHEMGDSAMIFRVRWWIESYVDTRRVYDRVNTALQEALDAAGIKMPYPTQSLYLQLDPETTDQLSRRLRASDQPPSSP
jgi:MscS family membrane protein